jgi:hypothetical protein
MSFMINPNEDPRQRAMRLRQAQIAGLEQGLTNTPDNLGEGLLAMGNAIRLRGLKSRQEQAAGDPWASMREPSATPSIGAALSNAWDNVTGREPSNGLPALGAPNFPAAPPQISQAPAQQSFISNSQTAQNPHFMDQNGMTNMPTRSAPIPGAMPGAPPPGNSIGGALRNAFASMFGPPKKF